MKCLQGDVNVSKLQIVQTIPFVLHAVSQGRLFHIMLINFPIMLFSNVSHPSHDLE